MLFIHGNQPGCMAEADINRPRLEPTADDITMGRNIADRLSVYLRVGRPLIVELPGLADLDVIVNRRQQEPESNSI